MKYTLSCVSKKEIRIQYRIQRTRLNATCNKCGQVSGRRWKAPTNTIWRSVTFKTVVAQKIRMKNIVKKLCEYNKWVIIDQTTTKFTIIAIIYFLTKFYGNNLFHTATYGILSCRIDSRIENWLPVVSPVLVF